MEYPFKDLLPLDEVLEREGYYKDWTHLDPEVFYSLTQISEYIKTKGFGVDVRLLIAQLAEHFGLKSTQIIDLANLLQQKFENLEGVTQNFTSNINLLVAKMEADKNQMEADKNAVIANATVDSEVILARGGKPTLQARLDDAAAKQDLLRFGQLTDVRTKGRKRRTMISFIDDDARIEVWEILKPFAEQNNIPYGIAVPPGNVLKDDGMYMSVEQVQTWHKEIGDIISHGWDETVGWDTATVAEMEYDAERTLKQLGEWGIDDVIAHAYHQGRKSEGAYRVSSKYFVGAFDITHDLNVMPYRSNRLYRDSIGGRTAGVISPITGLDISTTAHVKAMVDLAEERGGWLVFMTHVWYETFDLAQMQEVVDYIKSKGIEIVGVNEALQTTGNLIEIGDTAKLDSSLTKPYFIIDAEGNLDSHRHRFKVFGEDAFTINTQPLDFELNTVSVCLISSRNPSFPHKTGQLITSTVGIAYGSSGGRNATTSFQIFVPDVLGPNDIYMRKSYKNSQDEIVWGDFNSTKVNTTVLDNPLTAQITDYNMGITYSEIPSDNAEGFPENRAGTLITHRYNATFTPYNYQEYVIYNFTPDATPTVYRRGAQADGWTKFKSESSFAEIRGGDPFTRRINEYDYGIFAQEIPTANASQFPEGHAGTLITYRMLERDAYNHQEYIFYGSGVKYIRSATNDGGWTAFNKLTN